MKSRNSEAVFLRFTSYMTEIEIEEQKTTTGAFVVFCVMLMKHDVVYFLKEGIDPAELRYSLRSIEKNFEHGDVWFVGGQPVGFKPDRVLAIEQPGLVKWQKVRGMLARVCMTDEVPDDFWLFNDDFFILEPWHEERALYNGTLHEHILHIESRHGGQTGYTAQLRECERLLKDAGLSTLNYAIHCPMLINKHKMLETLARFPLCPMFRSLYGNMHCVDSVQHKDCKIAGLDRVPDDSWCSTTGESFQAGKVGAFIRDALKDPTGYEL